MESKALYWQFKTQSPRKLNIEYLKLSTKGNITLTKIKKGNKIEII